MPRLRLVSPTALVPIVFLVSTLRAELADLLAIGVFVDRPRAKRAMDRIDNLLAELERHADR